MAFRIFWTAFWISLIASIILLIVAYSKKKKFYPLAYILSIFTYINFVAFTIDAFDLDKNLILILLAVSAVIFIVLGVYFSKIIKDSQFSNSTSRRR